MSGDYESRVKAQIEQFSDARMPECPPAADLAPYEAFLPIHARYDIRFHRPVAVGPRARIEVDGTKRTTMERRNGRAMETMRDDTTQVRFVAVERVVAVGSTGKPTTVEYTIETFEVTEGGARTTALPAGAVLTVVRATQPGAEPRMQVNGRDVSAEVAAALAIAALSTR